MTIFSWRAVANQMHMWPANSLLLKHVLPVDFGKCPNSGKSEDEGKGSFIWNKQPAKTIGSIVSCNLRYNMRLG